MRVLLLADNNSIHTIKWAKALSSNGIEIFIFGFGEANFEEYSNYKNIRLMTLNTSITRKEGSFSKIKYLKALPIIKKIIRDFKPDIVHSHYASSYGLLGSLFSFKPFILSVWGSDAFNYPKKSFLHKTLYEYSLKKATKILSTSHVMAKEVKLYTNKNIEVTPFGIDLEVFKPQETESLFEENDIVIGTIKTLEEKYGIEYLVKAFKILVDKYPSLSLKLLIVGGGSLEHKLKELANKLNLSDKTIFTGKVPFEKVPIYNNMMSIYVSLSISNCESFGVAVVEAQACERPVVVSRIGGLAEVVDDDVTGYIVEPKSEHAAAEALEKLIKDNSLRKEMGKQGRKRVKKLYDWNDNINQMINIYKNILKNK